MAFHHPGVFDTGVIDPTLEPDLTVGFLLIPDFTMMPVAGFVESLRFAADHSFRSNQLFCRWSWMSENKQPVLASCGMEITPQLGLVDPTQFDYIAVAAGLLETATHPSEAIKAYLRLAVEKGVPLIGLCSGTVVLAEAGVLDQHHCAVHFTIWEYFKKRYPSVMAVVDSGHISDQNITTCPGGTAIDLAADIISRHCGQSRAKKGLDYLLVSPNEGDAVEQESVPLGDVYYENQLIEKSILLMQQNLSTPYPIRNLAEQIDTTERQLNRLFKVFMHSSPAAYWRKLRLEHSRNLLLNTSKPITSIAYETGFSDASHFSQWYKKVYGEPPAKFRRRRVSADL
ncbi:GlxA family transcriptional regulator [Amphritea sp.]|uniref:GlxA family transcriptional regulator n=1 Tax=Amphritea sp. TaxID=1872502 RepID=UPI003A90611D